MAASDSSAALRLQWRARFHRHRSQSSFEQYPLLVHYWDGLQQQLCILGFASFFCCFSAYLHCLNHFVGMRTGFVASVFQLLPTNPHSRVEIFSVCHQNCQTMYLIHLLIMTFDSATDYIAWRTRKSRPARLQRATQILHRLISGDARRDGVASTPAATSARHPARRDPSPGTTRSLLGNIYVNIFIYCTTLAGLIVYITLPYISRNR